MTIAITAADGCGWAAATTSKWVTLSGPPGPTGASGTGNGYVTAAADTNPDPVTRTASIGIANQVVMINEDAQQCTYSLAPPSASFGSSGGSGIVNLATSCSWTAVSNAPWLVVLNSTGKGNADVRYSVGRLPNAAPRTGTITVGTLAFTVNQSSSACALTLSTNEVEVPSTDGRNVVRVTGNSDCHWEPSVDGDGAEWLTITSWANVNGGGVVVYHHAQNDSVSGRQGTLRVVSAGLDPLTAAVNQDGATPIVSEVWNAATRRTGAVSPGELVVIRGQGLGPADGADQQLSDDGTTVLSTLAGIQVLFDGNPAPLLRVASGEVRAVVPYEIAGQQSTQMTVLNGGAVSNALTLDVVTASPGVFTLDGKGTGQIDATNPDGSPNTAANAVARGQVVTFFITGAGQTNPAGVDGLLNVKPLPTPVLPVTVQIGGQAAPIITAAGSSGEVAGRIRIDARVAMQLQPGAAIPVVVRLGQTPAQPGITIAVK